MPAVQQKNGKWRWRSKDGTLGKRGFNTKAAAQSQGRGPGKAGAKKPGKKKPGTSATTTPAKRYSPAIGATYQAVRGGAAALSPLTEVVTLSARGDFTLRTAGARARRFAALRGRKENLVVHEAAVLVDTAIDVRAGQAAAISRGSATAILPELYAAYEAVSDPLQAVPRPIGERVRIANQSLVITEFGFQPGDLTQRYTDPRFRNYRIGKHGGQLLRYARKKSKLVHRATEPLQKALSMIGGTI